MLTLIFARMSVEDVLHGVLARDPAVVLGLLAIVTVLGLSAVYTTICFWPARATDGARDFTNV
jgi:hypothetical protein